MPLLEIDIEARYAKFQDALSSIQRDTKKAAEGMSVNFDSVKGALAGLGSVASVGALSVLIKNAIDAADSLDDMAQKTGISVEALNGLGFAAGQAGGNLESVVAAAEKLNKSIADAASGGKESGAAFKALGLNVEDAAGNLKMADAVMAEVADQFAKYRDGPEKAALAVALFGKAGGDMIPFLNAGGEALRENSEYAKRYSGMTADLSRMSGEFNDKMAKLTLQQGRFGNVMATEVLPVLNLVGDKMLGAAEGTDRFSLAGDGIRTVLEALVVLGSEVAHTFSMVGDEIGGTFARLKLLGEGDFKGAWDLGDRMDADQAEALRKQKVFVDEVLDRSKKATSTFSVATTAGEKPPAPKIPGGGKGGQAGKGGVSAKDFLLDTQLRDLERDTNAEVRLLDARSDFLQTYYQNDLMAVQDYYAELRAAQDESVRVREAAIDREITLRQNSKPKDARAADNNDAAIKDLRIQKAQLQDAAELAATRGFLEEDRAARAFSATLKGINAELLEQQGNLPAAAASRFDIANDQIKRKITIERDSAIAKGDTAGASARDADLAKLDTIRSLVVAQAKLNSIGDIGARVQDDLANATERAQISAEAGNSTELASLRIISDARLQAVADLQQVATAFDEVAAATGNPRLVAQAQALQLEVDRLAVSADLVREKFEGAFQDPFDSFIDKLTSGTASLKDAVKGLFNDVASELTKIAARDLTSNLFKKNGSLGGLVDFASGLFGGQPTAATATPAIADAAASAAAAANTAAETAATVANTTAATASSVALTTMTAAATAAAAALAAAAASAGGGAAAAALGPAHEWFAGLSFAKGAPFDMGNVIPFAKGGLHGVISTPTMFPMTGGKTGLMGEAGPEAIMPLVRGPGGLSIKQIDERGQSLLLPVTRDQSGRMAVRGPDRKFATGGVFDGGSLRNAASTVVGMRDSVPAPGSGQADGAMEVHNHFTISGPVNAASQSQVAAAAAKGVARGRRNL